MSDTSNTKTENTRLRILITVMAGILSVFLYYEILNVIQYQTSMVQARKEMEDAAKWLETSYPGAQEPFNIIDSCTRNLYDEDMTLLMTLINIDQADKLTDEYLSGLMNGLGCVDIFITDDQGHTLASGARNYEELPAEAFATLKTSFQTGETTFYQEEMPAFEGEEEETVPAPETEAASDPEAASGQNEEELADVNYSIYWCARALDEKQLLLMENVKLERLSGESFSDGWSSLLKNRKVGKEGHVFVWSDETQQLLYYPDPVLVGQNVDVLGIDTDQIKDRDFQWCRVGGRDSYLYTTYYDEEKVWIACEVTRRSLENSRAFTRNIFVFAFALLAAMLVFYVILLLKQKRVKVLRDFTGSGKEIRHKSRQHKLLILTCLMVVILFLFEYYLQTLYMMSTWAEFANTQTSQIEQKLQEQEEGLKSFTDYYDSEKKYQYNLLATFLAEHKDLCTPSCLDNLSYAVRSFDIQILDSEGKALVGSSEMSYPNQFDVEDTDAHKSLAEKVARQDEGKSIFDWMRDGRCMLVPMTSAEDGVNGYLYARYYAYQVDQVLQSFSLNGTLSKVRPGTGGFVFSVDMETNTFSYYPESSMEGRDALQYGLEKNEIKDNYCDYITINGTPYYAVTDMIGTNLIYYSVTKNALLSQRLQICLLAAAAAAALLLLTGLALYTSKEQIEMVRPEEGRHTIREDKNSPEYRTMRVIKLYVLAASAIITAYSIFRENAAMTGVLGYVLAGNWERGFNVFALFSSAIILSKGGLILFVFSFMVQVVGDILPVRQGTILKMLGSLATYVAVAFLMYQCMICFGLNPTALMASAGIVSVVVGIGANSLVGDILAGIFLLMEGNVQVGDVVMIGDFRGYVMELGIRMTKLFDMETDDVKIIPNNEVRNVVHMTMRTSIVYSDFQIRYVEKLEAVERILREELKNVQDKSPLILEGPVYIGVKNLDANGVVLRCATRCHEPCRRKVEREVNHIVYSIFQKNHISVPYPQVTIHGGDDAPVERE